MIAHSGGEPPVRGIFQLIQDPEDPARALGVPPLWNTVDYRIPSDLVVNVVKIVRQLRKVIPASFREAVVGLALVFSDARRLAICSFGFHAVLLM